MSQHVICHDYRGIPSVSLHEVWCGSYDLVPETNDNNARLNLGAADS